MIVKLVFVSLIAAAAVVTSAARAQDVDFSRIPGVDTAPTVQVDLHTGMLSFVSALAAATDPSLAEALAGLERVRVFVYSPVQNRAALSSFVETSAERLERSGYERIVIAEEGGSKVRVHTKVTDTRLSGITLMVVEGEREAVFIDIAGDIDPAQLGRAMAKLKIDAGVDQIVGAAAALQGGQSGAPAAGAAATDQRPVQPTPAQ